MKLVTFADVLGESVDIVIDYDVLRRVAAESFNQMPILLPGFRDLRKYTAK
jgi:hypothetical protein